MAVSFRLHVRLFAQHACFATIFCVPVIMLAVDLGAQESTPASELRDQGEVVYRESCADCHGESGQGVEDVYADPLQGDDSVGQLAELISRTMPEGSPEDCVAEDAEAVAEFVHYAFYSEAARIRNRPPRISLARLTASQLRNSLADLYGKLQGLPYTQQKSGIKAKYYSDDDGRDKNKKLERIDSQINFDFKRESPVEGIDPKEFSIRWNGGLWVKETGRYELVVRSSCSFVMTFGHWSRELINNHVQSGDQTEFRRPLQLVGGRVYPFSITFRQRKRKTELPPAKISFSWVRPDGAEEVIPADNFVPDWVPPTFALQSALPPDDRSYGYERGIAINRDWDESTTAAALEFARVCYDDLFDEYRRKHKKKYKTDRDAIRAFALEFVQAAFHGVLSDERTEAFVDRQLAAEADDAEAFKRVCLVAIKSPAFLYPTADPMASESEQVATRLSLTLFDSLPLENRIRELGKTGAFESEQKVREYAFSAVNDYRVRAKTREFLYSWLNLQHVSDIVKDPEQFPAYSPEITHDLKASLDSFLDSVVWSESSDFRQFFVSKSNFTSRKLAEFYEGPWSKVEGEPDFSQASGQVLTKDSPEFFGILTHPYLLAGLAYHDATSPIHRGVFLIRYMLGRTLRPPAEAFSPLSPDLHPDLTTRERVSMQTSPDSCQVCHAKINPLGFTLESFDAVGRFREMDSEKPVDSSGAYIARNGERVEFSGIEDLANYLADSEDSRRAFVSRAFQHFVKQPPAAFGADTLEKLTQQFSRQECNIKKLIVEIAVIAAKPSQKEGDIPSVAQTGSGQ
ncbi:MAG: DUF1588 domain-containing protein [Pirellulaceae bacterium]